MSNMMESIPKRPSDRHGFKIGIICALSLEADMVELLFDQRYDKDYKYGRAPNDSNSYTTGVVANHNVVLTYCPGMGNDSAARTASRLMSSFTGIKVIIVVGICGAVPTYSNQGISESIFLGDCLISKAVIQLDLGREGPAGFKRKRGLDGLSRPTDQFRTLIAKLQTSTNRERLIRDLQIHLDRLRLKQPEKTKYPGKDQDRLYEPSYAHDHHAPQQSCEDCDVELGICAKDCEDLGCESRDSELRRLPEDNVLPKIHFGNFGSSNRVLKSGLKRDELAKINDIIAFEMEGAGVWDVCPTIVIKAACDYADSHKNKKWQAYSAAVAAAGLEAFLGELELFDDIVSPESQLSGQYLNWMYTDGIQAANTSRRTNDSSISELVHDADEAIRGYYKSSNRLHVERLTGEKLPLERCYINLGLINHSKRKEKEENEKLNTLFSMEARLQLDTINADRSISLNNLFEPGRLSTSTIANPRRIYIHGRAGVGKTTLCKKIVHEFLGGLWSRLFDRLLWLPLRSFKGRKDRYGWQELLQDAFSPLVEDWDKLAGAMAKKLLNKDFLSRTLLLFDGLDELSHRWAQEDKMFQFVEGIICDAPNVIITSRPQANSFDIGTFDLELETVGFSPAQVSTYLENCVRDKTSISKMKALIAEKPLIQGLLRIPIQLDAFCCTWSTTITSNQADKGISTMTTLYQSITNELFRKDVQRLQKAEQPRRLTDVKVSNHLQDELVFLEAYAFQGMVNNIVTFTPHHRNMIDQFLLNVTERTTDLDSFVLERLSFMRTSDVEENPSKRNYHFLHLTFQEFFAAKHFVRHWQADIGITCLGLNFDDLGEEEIISPRRFLQMEKYNPRFNIFWRFVTGLVQTQPRQVKTRSASLAVKNEHISTLFDQFNDKPLDLLGYSHRRLLMYCLSEVAPSGHRHIQELRTSEESALCQWIVSDHKSEKRILLGTEAEFPEHILCNILQFEPSVQPKDVLSALLDRPLVGVDTLRFVLQFMSCQPLIELQMTAIALVFKNSRPESEEIVGQAARLFQVLYEEYSLHDRKKYLFFVTFMAARRQFFLPSSIITILTTIMLEDKLPDWRSYAAGSLSAHCALPLESVHALEKALNDQDFLVRFHAVSGLANQTSIPAERITAVLAATLRDKHYRVRAKSLLLLEAHLSSVEEHVAVVLAVLRDDHWWVRASAAEVLGRQSLLDANGLAALTVAALKDKNFYVRTSAIAALGNQSSPPTEAFAILKHASEYGNSDTRAHAIDVMSKQSSLPMESIISTMTEVLRGTDPEERHSAAMALKEKSPLPEGHITVLLAMLRDGLDHDQIYDVLSIQHAFYSMIQHFNDERWHALWRYWTLQAKSKHICCYEFEDCLYVRYEGLLHQISSDALRTRQLLQVVLPTDPQPSQTATEREVQPDSEQETQSDSVEDHATGTERRTPRPRWRTLFKFKKQR